MLPAPFQAMDPADDLGWLAVADWLEENDDPRRAELTRLTRLLRHDLYHPDRRAREDRLMELLAAGAEPCVATMTNGIGMEFVYIPAGVFLMGSPPDEEGHQDAEGPVHEVKITRGFWLGKYPVTQTEYQAVTGKKPSHFSAEVGDFANWNPWFRGIAHSLIGRAASDYAERGGGKERVRGLETSEFPVETVSYDDALSFCRKLSRRGEEKGQKRWYRLPTEAEWEYSCRGGPLSQRFHFGNTLSESQGHVGNQIQRTTRVGLFPPNAFGLHDMHGNVWEWCSDWYDEEYYQNGDLDNPRGPKSGIARVLRGGSWHYEPQNCRSAARGRGEPANRDGHSGFRICCTPTL